MSNARLRGIVLPSRILILGPNGAGKSTLARLMGARLGLPVFHLDALHWSPGWVETERSAFREKVAQTARQDAWIIDGNYTRYLDLRLSHADAVIWLDLPRYVYFPRVIWRTIRHYGRERGDLGPGCPERFDARFLADWVWTYPTRRRPEHAALMASLPDGVSAIILKSRAEVSTFTDGLPDSLERPSHNNRRDGTW